MGFYFRQIATVIGIIGITVNLASAKTNGGYAGAFLRMGLGAEAIAQGDAFSARADNGFAVYYNPAGLSLQKSRYAALSYSNLALDRSFNYVGVSFPLPPTAGVALGWINAGVTNIDGRDFDGNHYGNLEYFQNAFYFGFSNRFSNYVSAGIGVKIIYDLFPDMLEDNKALKSSGVGFDAGIIVRPWRTLRIGLLARDINAKDSWDTSEYWSEGLSKNDVYPTVYKAALAYSPILGVEAEYDLEVSSQNAVEHHFGMEYALVYQPERMFCLRMGYDQDSPAVGFGYMFPVKGMKIAVDAAYVIEDVSPEDTMIFSWSFIF